MKRSLCLAHEMPNEFVAKGRLKSMGKGAWTLFFVPRNISDAIGRRGKIAVRGTIDGTPFRGTLIPQGDGTHTLPVTKIVQAAAGVGDGDLVTVKLAVDVKPPKLAVPGELKRVLAANPRAKDAFDALAPSHRKAWIEFVSSAKGLETRQRRAAKTAVELVTGKKNPRD